MKKEISAPKCKTLPHVRKYYNTNNPEYTDEVNDPYHWLIDKSNQEVIDYLIAENNYTNYVMSDTKKLQEQLFLEFKNRIQETDSRAPWPHDNYLYYFRTIAEKEYHLFCRKNINDQTTDSEQILLDKNLLAEQYDFFNIGDLEVSPCHNYIAYTVDTIGNECYELYIKDLNTNESFNLNIQNISPDIEWSADSKVLLYLKLDELLRPYELNCFNCFEFLTNKKLNTQLNFTLHYETDEKFRLCVERTRSKEYLIITAQSKISTEVYYLPAHNLTPDSINKIQLIKPRLEHVEYYIEHHRHNNQNHFYILLSSEKTPNFELYKVDLNTTTDLQNTNNWQLIIPHDINTKLDHLDCFKDYCILFTKSNGLNNLYIINNYNFTKLEKYDIELNFKEQIYDIAPANNEMYDHNEYRLQYESMSTPHSIYSVKISQDNNYQLTLIKTDSVLNNYNKSDYISERLFVNTAPNVSVPISLIYNKNKYKKDGSHPLLLYGYGSYGISIDPYFSYTRISLLDRGIAFAIAHIRGGGELGEPWHHQGRMHVKTNTFLDFIKCSEYLIHNKYTSAAKLIIQGGSAGGLLIGYVINQRPELFNIAIAEVPFVDCLNTMLDPTLPLTVTEYDEWGNPTDSALVYQYIKSYAPYENIKTQNYPHLLINNSLEDTRVCYWEAAKWTAKLRTHKLDNNLLLLNTEMAAGHGGVSGRYQAMKDTAFTYSFILKCLNYK
jgi:oligopeptidase B